MDDLKKYQPNRHASEYSVAPSQWNPGFLLEKCRYATFTQMHWHNEVELTLLARGSGSVIIGHARNQMRAGELALYWGIVPHGVAQVTEGNPTAYSLHIPMAWFMEWGLPMTLVDRILSRNIVRDRLQRKPCSDLALMKHWHTLLMSGEERATLIVVHEVQARLRRMAWDLSHRAAETAEDNAPRDRHSLLVERMIREIGEHHCESITVESVALTAGISPSHAMHLFSKECGITMYNYIQHCRVATAQHLLLTTDDKVVAVGNASGFRSPATFFTAFKRITGLTAGRYRKSARTVANGVKDLVSAKEP